MGDAIDEDALAASLAVEGIYKPPSADDMISQLQAAAAAGGAGGGGGVDAAAPAPAPAVLGGAGAGRPMPTPAELKTWMCVSLPLLDLRRARSACCCATRNESCCSACHCPLLPLSIPLRPRSCVYCCYIDAARRPSAGRRISLARAGACVAPTMQDVQQAAQKLGYHYLLFEMTKKHPRDPWQPGRMRLELFNADGSPIVPGITTKLQLLGRLADVVPTLGIYAARMAQMDKMRAAHIAAEEKAARANKGKIAKAVAETAAQTGGAAAKKNKKK